MTKNFYRLLSQRILNKNLKKITRLLSDDGFYLESEKKRTTCTRYIFKNEYEFSIFKEVWVFVKRNGELVDTVAFFTTETKNNDGNVMRFVFSNDDSEMLRATQKVRSLFSVNLLSIYSHPETKSIDANTLMEMKEDSLEMYLYCFGSTKEILNTKRKVYFIGRLEKLMANHAAQLPDQLTSKQEKAIFRRIFKKIIEESRDVFKEERYISSFKNKKSLFIAQNLIPELEKKIKLNSENINRVYKRFEHRSNKLIKRLKNESL